MIFFEPPPLDKILDAPLMPNVSYMIQKYFGIANGKKYLMPILSIVTFWEATVKRYYFSDAYKYAWALEG